MAFEHHGLRGEDVYDRELSELYRSNGKEADGKNANEIRSR
jgi:hypothetical protein